MLSFQKLEPCVLFTPVKPDIHERFADSEVHKQVVCQEFRYSAICPQVVDVAETFLLSCECGDAGMQHIVFGCPWV